jgi:DNA-binding transcriptional regulator YiaG
MTETPLKQPKIPVPGTLAERVRHTLDRLHLDDTRGAAYLGVPVFTVRKWITGEREPGAAVARLLDVLGMVEAMAPALHGSFMPAESVHVKKSRTKKENKP